MQPTSTATSSAETNAASIKVGNQSASQSSNAQTYNNNSNDSLSIFSATKSANVESTANTPNSNDNTSNVDAEWYLAPGIKGEGPKPQGFIDSKYKSVLEQAEGYNNLRKKLGGFTGAPEEYEVNLDKLGDDYKGIELSKDDPAIKGFLDTAKELNMNQEAVNKFIKYKLDLDKQEIEYENKLIHDYTTKEVEKLGPEASQRIETLSTWWKQNFPDFPLEKMQNLGQSADFVEMLETIKSKFKFNPVPTSSAAIPSVSRDEARKMLTDPQYRNDLDYRKKVDAIYSKFV